MHHINLVCPDETMESQAKEFKREFFDCGESVISGGLKLDSLDDYGEWLAIVKDSYHPDTVNPKWGVTHTFFAIKEEDNTIVGVVNIRLYLTEKFREFGHIGYSVRPSERRKGYAIVILKKILEYAQLNGMREVDLVCKSNNVASIKTILRVCNYCRRTSADDKEVFHINL
jgi:predicted acetyltransferase